METVPYDISYLRYICVDFGFGQLTAWFHFLDFLDFLTLTFLIIVHRPLAYFNIEGTNHDAISILVD